MGSTGSTSTSTQPLSLISSHLFTSPLLSSQTEWLDGGAFIHLRTTIPGTPGASWSVTLPKARPATALKGGDVVAFPSAPRAACTGPPGACSLAGAPPCGPGRPGGRRPDGTVEAWTAVRQESACAAGSPSPDKAPAGEGGAGLAYGLRATFFPAQPTDGAAAPSPAAGASPAACPGGPRDPRALGLLPGDGDAVSRCQEGMDLQVRKERGGGGG